MTLSFDVIERALPLRVPFVIARGAQTTADLVHLRLSRDGVIGWGEASPSPAVTPGTPSDVARSLRRLDPGTLELDDIASTLAHCATLPAAARAALDLALHDLRGRLDGRPAFELLGLPDEDAPTAATITITDPVRAVVEARAWFRRFFHVLKVKIGDPVEGLAMVRAIHEALPEAELFVDANESLTVDTTAQFLHDVADLGVTLVEQPLPRTDVDGLARVLQDAPVPVFVDEGVCGPADVERYASLEGPLGFNIKVQKVGGLVAASATLDAARAQGRQTLVGCNIESGLGIAAGAAFVGAVDHVDLDGNLFLAHDPFPFPRAGPGHVGTLEGAGLGVNADPRFVGPIDPTR